MVWNLLELMKWGISERSWVTKTLKVFILDEPGHRITIFIPAVLRRVFEALTAFHRWAPKSLAMSSYELIKGESASWRAVVPIGTLHLRESVYDATSFIVDVDHTVLDFVGLVLTRLVKHHVAHAWKDCKTIITIVIDHHRYSVFHVRWGRRWKGNWLTWHIDTTHENSLVRCAIDIGGLGRESDHASIVISKHSECLAFPIVFIARLIQPYVHRALVRKHWEAAITRIIFDCHPLKNLDWSLVRLKSVQAAVDIGTLGRERDSEPIRSDKKSVTLPAITFYPWRK